ncbi:sigma-54-dependent transcriptional regulator [Desulfurivibrio dismutans]|uniref:sigma-54-dependent transcriptional regulator n=1 Tax=Desulfurivibrio dismutans TaxID=1398908 RepID=UPI0023DBA2EC|nr:sigma-54 dependent transcriptional regulator [Desulfurivibrio alkaliphilus]MDF1614659.1 sigma-54 dependent transcriptional regulator [Desulfurivibrio alkaliphilus]
MGAKSRKILVVDDEQNMRVALYEALSRGGYEVKVAENGRMALEMVASEAPDLVVTDIRMPEMDGIEMLQKVQAVRPGLPVVIITGYATVETAVEAMKQGAVDYILKPFPVEVIEETIKKVFREGPPSASATVAAGVGPAPAVDGPTQEGARTVIGRDRHFLRLLERARAVASSKATVLVLGESGTGKEVFARFIHHVSDRKAGPFVALNCAALPEGLLESELFGHEKGAFTGAVMAKKGKFELAHGGTLLLDEIGEVPLHLQAKLLRVLQEEEVDRLGGKEPVKLDVHVVATTNRDLAEAVKGGTFRQDLYYRLNVIPIRLPDLRERPDDIFLLADFFIEKHSQRYGKPLKKLSAAARQRFLEYDWPGNVREMENLLERGVLLSTGAELELWDFWDDELPPEPATAPAAKPLAPESATDFAPVPEPPPEPDPASDSAHDRGREAANSSAPEPDLDPILAGRSLRDVERQMILQALRQTADNRTHAAKMLGISVRTLRNKLNEYRNQGML